MKRYEVALKGAYRKKRVVLGEVELDSANPEAALMALGWKFYEERLDKCYMKDNILICLRQVSVRPLKKEGNP